MAEFNEEEQRTIIKLCATLGKSPVDTMKMPSKATGKPLVCRSPGYKWHRRFSDGKKSTEDDSRPCRPGLINADLVDSVRDMIKEDRRVSIREPSDQISVGKTTVVVILEETLEINKMDTMDSDRGKQENKGIGINGVLASSTPSGVSVPRQDCNDG